jgi:two-component system, chemotaxis family, response regulator Rcp1
MNEDVHILLVEDNEGDSVLTMEALKEARIINNISVVKDGEKALQFLNKEGEFTSAKTPDIIFLDINLPRIDGTEILGIIKNSLQLKTIPVIMLTTSDAEQDIMKSYNNHANCYITKPVDIEKFMNVVHTIRNFWIRIVQLPKTND